MDNQDNKFANCFIDADPLYEYDIYYDGELLAKAKTQSAKDKSYIERKSMTKKFDHKTGDIEIDIDTNALKSATIYAAIKEWYLPRKLTEDNIDLLSGKLRDTLFDAIQEHESKINDAVENAEKN
jgi:hypothetical protein